MKFYSRNRRQTLNGTSQGRLGLPVRLICSVVAFVLASLWGLLLYRASTHRIPSLANSGVIGPSSKMLESDTSSALYITKSKESLGSTHDGSDNPFFGWQPPSPSAMACSWRECFKSNHKCTTCRDRVEDLAGIPPVPDNWVPDVTMLYRMRVQGRDQDGNPWPPPLDKELCEQIGVSGGFSDDNKMRKYVRVPRFLPIPIKISISFS